MSDLWANVAHRSFRSVNSRPQVGTKAGYLRLLHGMFPDHIGIVVEHHGLWPPRADRQLNCLTRVRVRGARTAVANHQLR